MVGSFHDIEGQAVHAYVVLNASEEGSEALESELAQWVRRELGPIATPECIRIVLDLPRTGSGKITRRIYRKIAESQVSGLGDTSTLSDPAILNILQENSDAGRGTSGAGCAIARPLAARPARS